MAEYRFGTSDSWGERFASECDLLREANALPQLSSPLRDRVLKAAAAAYRQAQRWAQARQAASFLSLCLIVSFVLSPLASVSIPQPSAVLADIGDWRSSVATHEPLTMPMSRASAGAWRNNRELLGPPPNIVDAPQQLRARSYSAKSQGRQSTTIARAEVTVPRDRLLAALQTSEGWATVEAFEAVRARGLSALQHALSAN